MFRAIFLFSARYYVNSRLPRLLINIKALIYIIFSNLSYSALTLKNIKESSKS